MSWRFEDGGPRRRQVVPGSLGLSAGRELVVTSRTAPMATMTVAAPDGARYLLRHTPGEGAVALVERIDPVTLDPLATSPALAGGPVWPGGAGVHDNGGVYVVFGNHAHRLDPSTLQPLASRTLPRDRPYNSFVPLPDGHLAVKDFGAFTAEPCQLLVLEPEGLTTVARLDLPERSIARLSADDDTVYVVGDTSLLRVEWDGAGLRLAARTPYRTTAGQTFGWDCVLAAGAAWLLDDGEGTEAYSGTLRGHGVSSAPLHLVRVDLRTHDVTMAEVCGLPGGLVANPPVVDEGRGVVVGYDSGNGVMTGFDLATLRPRWQRKHDHASHLLLYEWSGELVTGDGTDIVVLDIATGEELARADIGGGVQSVLFPCPGPAGSGVFYVCSFLAVSRVEVAE